MSDVGIVGNGDIWTVVFVDRNDEPTDPDGPVTWTVYDRSGREIEGAGEVQQPGDKVDTGTFEFVYTPTAAGEYSVKASAEVDGIPQASAATKRTVVR